MLVGRLAGVLEAVPADPFTPEVVAVPSRGVERWIAQSLSTTLGAAAAGADGVCANVVFPSPGRLVRDALAAACDVDPDEDPWAPRRLVWPLLEVIDGCAHEDWCRTLGRHLGVLEGALDQGRRMAVAQKLTGLYAAYAAERPAMLRAWRAGQDTDGYDGPLAADLSWQAELWRRLRDHVRVDSTPERLEPGCRRLREEPQVADLPDRFSIFGPTRLTTEQLTVIDALAAHRDVHLWLPHPSEGLWRHVGSGGSFGQPGRACRPVSRRREDPTAEIPRHPLVRSLGRDAREMQLRLAAHTTWDTDEHLEARPAAGTLLAALQGDLHADRAPTRAHHLAEGDTSIQVHACHGRHRQVEVLREVLLGLLDDDPTLELRDIIVMCPDVEAYAPLVSAAFGVDGGPDDGHTGQHPGHQLTFRLADRALRQTNPVLGVVARLLELADSRLTTSEVLDLLATQPVRRRFHLDDDALERVGDWVRRAGVRWGLDADARAPYGLAGVSQNTWRHGLDRILVGVTMDEDGLRSVGSALPLDDVDGTEVDLAGRLAELLDRLAAAIDVLTREQPLDAWIQALTDAVDSFTEVSPADAWQVSQAKATLAATLAAAGGTSGSLLRLSDIRALLGDRLAGRPTRANFRTGHLTVCTMVPMRSVPHRVVCLLGLDDGVFPRSTRIDGDDILARDPRVGERDQRSEDRQLFLDAILAAKERLVILYTGADERTGAERPPAVPLGELLDVLDRTATTADPTTAGGVRDRVLVRHPLQPFDARNFAAGELTRGGPFSFDTGSYDGSLVLRGDRAGHPPFLDTPLPEPEATDAVSLETLTRFLEHPVRGFLRERLDVRTADEQDEPSDAIPVAPDSLELWKVGDRLLRAGLSGLSRDAAQHVERLRGELPPGRLGAGVLDPVTGHVDGLLDKSANLRAVAAESYDVSVELPSGLRLDGTVPRVHAHRVLRIEYSKLSAKHRIRAWVQLLALTVQYPDRDWTAATVGRGDRRAPVLGSFLRPVPADEARDHLDRLVAVYRLGLTRPLPVPPKTACAYAEKRRSDVNPDTAAQFAGRQWLTAGSSGTWGEYDDGDHRRCGLRTLEDLLADAPVADLPHAEEPHLFGQLARTIWTPLLEAEEITS